MQHKRKSKESQGKRSGKDDAQKNGSANGRPCRADIFECLKYHGGQALQSIIRRKFHVEKNELKEMGFSLCSCDENGEHMVSMWDSSNSKEAQIGSFLVACGGVARKFLVESKFNMQTNDLRRMGFIVTKKMRELAGQTPPSSRMQACEGAFGTTQSWRLGGAEGKDSVLLADLWWPVQLGWGEVSCEVGWSAKHGLYCRRGPRELVWCNSAGSG
mmetsp:Transcript_141026/g.450257  ORF Transcript_141026/g.450257 Transcript_141026/m.450257 type:complete len:215 (-) Transcript_141026:1282-1926(-)